MSDKRVETHACDLISRQDAIDAIRDALKRIPTTAILAMDAIEKLPSAEPEKAVVAEIKIDKDDLAELVQEKVEELAGQLEIIRCKDCRHFYYDKPYVVYGVPVLGHEVCDFWGDGCKTNENGFCSYAERREE